MKKSRADQPSPDNATPRLRLKWWHGALVASGAVAALVIHLAPVALHSASSTYTHPDQVVPPWGRIECTSMYLQRTDEMFPGNPPPPLEWVFDGRSEEQIVELLNGADLTDGQRRQLLDRARWKPFASGWRIATPPEVVRGLSPSARLALYPVLGRSPFNYYHVSPFRLDAEQFETWLAYCGLPDEKQLLFRQLTYAEGGTVFFADMPYLESQLTREEILSLGKSISQTPTLMMNLRVGPDSDIDALAGYWGRAGRGLAMKSFLASLAKVPGGCAVSVSWFFPTFARMHLFTYPDIKADPDASRQDCFWTAMNFFQERPDDRYFDWEFTRQSLRTDYVRVTTGRVFGDLVMLVDANQNAVHLCVYVADDVVFTKNGADMMQPWVLMRIPEMMKRYAFGRKLETVVFRRKAG
jgi:hypothetical protein